MKMLRYLFVIALVCGLTHVAKADDFQMVVADPTVPLDVIQPVYTDDFALTFPISPSPAAGCGAPGQLPSSVPAGVFSACFTGVNLTGAPLTSLQIEFPVFDYPGTSTPDLDPVCPTLSSGDDFSGIACGLTNGDADYLLSFTGGDIPTATLFNSFCYFDPFVSGAVDCYSPAIFTIAIGIPGDDLLTDGVITTINGDDVTAVANVIVTPEPSSFLLMSTGVFSLGLFGACQRRRTLVVARQSTAASLD